jgi:SAM-dependent methyltransferase
MSLRGRLAVARDKKGVHLPRDPVHEIIERHSAQDWFKTAFDLREKYYWNCWAPSFWLAKRLPSRARILETGCGCGTNLLWFAQHGFRNLYGFDNDPKAIAAAIDLSRLARVVVNFWVDDALSPSKIPSGVFDCVLALNWTYLLQDFTIETLLRNYVPCLTAGGYLVFDVVDPSYASDPRNVYCTQDWERPEEQRRPTEYPTRYSLEDLRGPAQNSGLHHLETISFPQRVPKVVYIFCARQRR